MLKIGCRHKVDIEAFKMWHEENGYHKYNAAGEFLTNETEKLYLIEIEDESDDFYGERFYYFSERKNGQSCETLYFWNGSLDFFTPIEDVEYVQEEMEL